MGRILTEQDVTDPSEAGWTRRLEVGRSDGQVVTVIVSAMHNADEMDDEVQELVADHGLSRALREAERLDLQPGALIEIGCAARPVPISVEVFDPEDAGEASRPERPT